jgi:crotonobetainyl-CoA:carnitine CoA-transferase CaiB-like acyl-CoA transferase
VYTAGDGQRLVLAVGSDGQFKQLCEVLQRAEWSQDQRFLTNAARVTHREVLEALLAERLSRVSGAEILLLLEDLAVPAGAVRTVGEALAHATAEDMLLPTAGHFPKGLRTVAFTSEGWPRAASLSPPPPLPQPGGNELS